jgi:hypothetical protein
MKDSFELKVGPDGTIETIYQDGIEQFAEEMGAEVSTICRASNVEWEEVPTPLNARFPATKGWSVRSVKNDEKALRMESSLNAGIGDRYIDTIVCSDNKHLAIALFPTREEAIQHEIKHFWELKNG